MKLNASRGTQPIIALVVPGIISSGRDGEICIIHVRGKKMWIDRWLKNTMRSCNGLDPFARRGPINVRVRRLEEIRFDFCLLSLANLPYYYACYFTNFLRKIFIGRKNGRNL